MPPESESEIPESFDDWMPEPPSLPEVFLLPDWAWWLIGTVAAGIFLFALFKIRKHLAIPPLPSSARDTAIDELSALKARSETLPPPEMGSTLAAAINRYFHRRYGELAEFRTREELFDPGSRLEDSPPLPPGVAERFRSLFARCEEMRFAGRRSTPKTRLATISDTLAAVRDEAA